MHVVSMAVVPRVHVVSVLMSNFLLARDILTLTAASGDARQVIQGARMIGSKNNKKFKINNEDKDK